MEKSKITVGLDNSDILKRVYLISGYIAGKQGDDLLNFDRISAIENDEEYLDVLIEDVAGDLALLFGFLLDDYSWEDDLFEYSVSLNCNTVMMQRVAESYVSGEVLRRWLVSVGEAALAEIIGNEVAEKRGLIVDIISRGATMGKVASPRRVEGI